MSYCRFENTYSDFDDCLDALSSGGLESLSDSERHYAERIYELAKSYVGVYEMNLQENEESQNEPSDEPSFSCEKNQFLQYYRVQKKGNYNMITEVGKAAKAAGLTLDTYYYIQANYHTLRLIYESDCKIIDKQLVDELMEKLREEMYHEG